MIENSTDKSSLSQYSYRLCSESILKNEFCDNFIRDPSHASLLPEVHENCKLGFTHSGSEASPFLRECNDVHWKKSIRPYSDGN